MSERNYTLGKGAPGHPPCPWGWLQFACPFLLELRPDPDRPEAAKNVCRPRISLVLAALTAATLLLPAAAAAGTARTGSGVPHAAPGGAAGDRLGLTVATGRIAAVERQVSALGGEVPRRLPLLSALA